MKCSASSFLKDSRGFSVIELLLVLGIVMVVTTLALLGASQARSNIKMMSGAELVKGTIERAFTDARKRHAGGSDRPQIIVTGPSSFNVTLDFSGDGIAETRPEVLPSGITFVYDQASPPTATIDWRGMVAEGDVTFNLRSREGDTVSLKLSGAGDASINTVFGANPTISQSAYSTDVTTGASFLGNATPNPNPSPTASPTPLPTCTGTQVAETTPCRCATGKHVDPASGKCK